MLDCNGHLVDNDQKINLEISMVYFNIENGKDFSHKVEGTLFARVEQ